MQYLANHWFLGPNWLADVPVIDSLCVLEPFELQLFAEHGELIRDQLLMVLGQCGIEERHQRVLREAFPAGPKERFARLYGGTAIALQRQAGHDVMHCSVLLPKDREWFRAVYGCVDEGTGNDTWKLALLLVSKAVADPAFQLGPLRKALNAPHLVGMYLQFAGKRAMPGDSLAIARAAERAGVPWLRYNLPGFESREDRKPLRPLGGLLLGQGKYSHELDGTFCVDRCRDLLPLAHDRRGLLQKLSALGAPVHEGPTEPKGARYRVLLANHRVVAVLAGDCTDDHSAAVHGSLLELACEISRELGAGILLLEIAAPDISEPPANSGTVVGAEIAPRLDSILHRDSPFMEAAADALIEWLYPQGSQSRMPIFMVTGTNGKTTTCRMISHVAVQAGYTTGLSCNEGMYINGERIRDNEDTEFGKRMYMLQLENRSLELSVMEFFLARIRHHGHLLDWSNVSVCTNVTREHLHKGMETAMQMAEVKASIIGAARDGVVVNADDPHWMLMLGKTRARKVCLASQKLGIEGLRERMSPGRLESEFGIPALCYSLVEMVDGREQFVIYDGEDRLDLLPVSGVPATFGGAARFNVDNAMHAMAACYLGNLPLTTIRQAIATFDMNFERTPGRQNIHDNGSFKVIMDYAHNSDGFRRLADFAHSFRVEGRRLLMLAVGNDRKDELVKDIALAVAGRFDHFVCRTYTDQRAAGKSREGTVSMLVDSMLEAGVPKEQITVETDPMSATELALSMGEPGDLLVLTAGNYEFEPIWQRITAFPGKPEGSS